MIVLDTNVLSEPLRPSPNPSVISWLDAQSLETLFVTTLTIAEIRYGIAVLPQGQRRQSLQQRFDTEVLPLFDRRVLDFDVAAADAFGDLRGRARAQGVTVGDMDALIAAVAVVRDVAVATRDTGPFEALGAEVINPFA